jgi:3-dehydroquinate synthase
VAIVADETVASLHAARVEAALGGAPLLATVSFPAGEKSKTRATKERIEDELVERGLGRDGVIVALGGGVTTDLAGFVASTYLRGVPWMAVPTSLLAAVDAAIGGKTGVDTPLGKNLIGSFHRPLAVLIDLDLLSTLPREEVDNGLAEMVKHAVIADAAYLEELVQGADGIRALEPEALEAPLRRSVEIKAAVVHRDPEEQDERQVLNCGHTIAHAIEKTSSFRVRHGLAVSSGLSVEAGIACRLGILDSEERDRLRTALTGLGLPVAPPRDLAPSEILAATAVDKKGRKGRPRYALPEALGRMARGPEGYGLEVEDSVVLAALEETLSCFA